MLRAELDDWRGIPKIETPKTDLSIQAHELKGINLEKHLKDAENDEGGGWLDGTDGGLVVTEMED